MACPPLERYAAIRPAVLDNGTLIEQPDLSTLSDTNDGALRLAQRRDEQNHMAIRRGNAYPFRRIARVRVEEVA